MADGRLHYARNGDIRLAYQVFGEADTTQVWVPHMLTNINYYEDPENPYGVFIQLLAPHMRVLVSDGRGTGLSYPVPRAPTLQERVDDMLAVLEAAEVDSAIVNAAGFAGPVALAFAATYPERVTSLVLNVTAARFCQDLPEYPWGFTTAEVDRHVGKIDAHWGEGALTDLALPSIADLPGVRDQFGRLERSVMSPSMAKLHWRATLKFDVRAMLDSVRCPVLVTARPGDQVVPFEASAALAAALPTAQFVTLPPGDHACFDIVDVLAGNIIAFCADPSAIRGERILATVMFTDIVGSTESLSAGGDGHWSHLLDLHDRLVDSTLTKYGGTREKHTGDGVLAVFDGSSHAARAAMELVPTLAQRGLRIRVGIHVGEFERRGQEWCGLAVHTGARICALAGAGEVLASRTVRDLSAGSGMVFEDLGPQRLKGLAEDVEVFRVTHPAGATNPAAE